MPEHYNNFDEREHSPDLFDYPLQEDRETEWYSRQPVGEVIYQEYSNVEVARGDYLTSGLRINVILTAVVVGMASILVY